jgi:hypothetical protein
MNGTSEAAERFAEAITEAVEVARERDLSDEALIERLEDAIAVLREGLNQRAHAERRPQWEEPTS